MFEGEERDVRPKWDPSYVIYLYLWVKVIYAETSSHVWQTSRAHALPQCIRTNQTQNQGNQIPTAHRLERLEKWYTRQCFLIQCGMNMMNMSFCFQLSEVVLSALNQNLVQFTLRPGVQITVYAGHLSAGNELESNTVLEPGKACRWFIMT